MALALPDFIYRAVMDNGIVEHELCPVVVAEVEGAPPAEPRRGRRRGVGVVGRAAAPGAQRTRVVEPVGGPEISRLDELGAAPRGGSTHRRCRSTSMCRPSTAPPFPGRAAALSRPFPQSTRSPPSRAPVDAALGQFLDARAADIARDRSRPGAGDRHDPGADRSGWQAPAPGVRLLGVSRRWRV